MSSGRRRRSLVGFGVVSILAVAPAVAGAATLNEIGTVADGRAPQCPEACSVITRTTAMPTSTNGDRNVYAVPSNGTIVAWSITLGNPSETDRRALERQLGRARAQLTVLRRGKSVAATAVGESPLKHLDPYFGGEVTFALPQTITVRKGDLIGLTVSSWAPSLVQGYDTKTSWRASRPAGRCGGTTEDRKADYYVDTTLASGKSGTFNCLYKAERLAFSATFVPTPTRRTASSR
jgi:hypothetical protein